MKHIRPLIFGFVLPAWARLVEIVTGEKLDISCGTIFIGIIIGWIPGMILSSIGVLFNMLIKKIIFLCSKG